MQIHLNDFLFSVSRALDSVEHEFMGVAVNHSKRTAYISMRLCAHVGCSAEEIFDMASCAVLHDNALTEYALQVGKKGAAQLENIAYHCRSGEENARSFPFLGDTKNIVLHHHENWDGSGYFALAGNDISLRAAALRIADNMDVLFSFNTYDANTEAKVREHLIASRENLYNPVLVDAFLEILNEGMLRDMTDTHIDAALSAIMPDCKRNIASEEMLMACQVFAAIIDARSRFTLRHTVGIAQKVAVMAEHYQFSREHTNNLVIAAYLHDIGKLTIPLSILEKEGPLDEDEFQIMRGHALASYAILESVRGLEDIAVWAPSHHEKLDGSGYPQGKKGDALSRESRLLTCVDIYQALREDRPYRAGMSHSKAIGILYEMADQGKLDRTIVTDMDEVFGVPDVCPISSVYLPYAPSSRKEQGIEK